VAGSVSNSFLVVLTNFNRNEFLEVFRANSDEQVR
jgi:hypothetical protein